MAAVSHRFIIAIEPKGWQLEAPASSTLLEAAQLCNVSLPSACRNGTCRTCMCRLVCGSVSYKIAWPGLSTDEKNEGFILPCVAYPESDVVIEVPAAVALSSDKT